VRSVVSPRGANLSAGEASGPRASAGGPEPLAPPVPATGGAVSDCAGVGAGEVEGGEGGPELGADVGAEDALGIDPTVGLGVGRSVGVGRGVGVGVGRSVGVGRGVGVGVGRSVGVGRGVGVGVGVEPTTDIGIGGADVELCLQSFLSYAIAFQLARPGLFPVTVTRRVR
jgi:hypothetical protein